MPLHLLKTAVGIRAIEHLEAVQRPRVIERDGISLVPGFTRHRPTQVDAVENGGSIYWIIQGAIACRQRVIALDCDRDEEGRSYCRMMLDPVLIHTVPLAHKHIQGWRYLDPAKAPEDLDDASAASGMPPAMVAELRSLGLL